MDSEAVWKILLPHAASAARKDLEGSDIIKLIVTNIYFKY